MPIQITRQLKPEEYIKLFSNPISGIACTVDSYNRDHRVKIACRHIRYSKSMLIGALTFWSDQMFNMYLKMTKVYNPLDPMADMGIAIMDGVDYLENTIKWVKNLPDSFLFSHRYIDEMSVLNDAFKIQKKLLLEKFGHIGTNVIKFQRMTTQPFMETINNIPFGLSFTVFPNEHPYIKREKIVEVGETAKGNTYIVKKP